VVFRMAVLEQYAHQIDSLLLSVIV
jgi:hypothetical protein